MSAQYPVNNDNEVSLLKKIVNNSAEISGGGGSSLPDQSGQGGKVLGTDGSTASWVAQSGGSSLLQSVTVTLTDAQIKALPSEPFLIVTASAPNKMIVPISAIWDLNNLAGAYTGVADASWILETLDWDYLSGPTPANFLSNPARRIGQFAIPYTRTFPTGNFVTEVEGTYFSNDNPPTSSIFIHDSYMGISDYGGGNAANTLKITLYYAEADI